jgi:SnoaL-like domain
VGLSLEDRSEIIELLSQYGLLLDRHRIDEWMQLFVPDATLKMEGNPPWATAAAREELGRTAPKGTHLAAPPVILEGKLPNSAVAEQTFLFRAAASGRMLAGWYEDVLVNVEGAWRFQLRSIYFHRERQDPPV